VLDLSAIDLDMLVTALQDGESAGSWCIDAETGEVLFRDPYLDGGIDDEHRDLRCIDPLPSSVAYRDMEDFIAAVPDRRLAERLRTAITGRGAFRRFRAELSEHEELRAAWRRFEDVRVQRRGIELLVDEGLIDPSEADRVLAALPDAPIPGAAVAEPHAVAAAVAGDLRRLYGARLVDVVLYGSQARGDAHPESDLDLAVVLDAVASPWEELRRMDEVLWRHTLRSGITISALPVSKVAWADPSLPLLRTARAEGLHFA